MRLKYLRGLRPNHHWGTYRNSRECRPWFAIGPVKSGRVVGVDIAIAGYGLWLAPFWWRDRRPFIYRCPAKPRRQLVPGDIWIDDDLVTRTWDGNNWLSSGGTNA
jgi:hypothetical protein